jgi:hypothetical protein
LIAPPVPHGASFPPASFREAAAARLFDEVAETPALAVYAERVELGEDRLVGQGGRRCDQLTGRLVARVEDDARGSGREPERVERGLVDAGTGEAAACDPERVRGRRRVELGEREDLRTSSWFTFHPPAVVQIQRPSSSSIALAAYMASACARLVTRSSRTTWVQQ